MDPIEKRKYPIYHPSTSRNHPHPPPTMPSNTSIHSISNNFSKLYTNHKIISSLKQTDKIIHPHPHPEPSTKHAPTTTLTKSKSQHGTRTNAVKDRVLVKAQLVEKFLNPKQVHETTQKELVDRRKFGKFLKPKEAHETAQKEWKTKELVEVEEKVKQQDVKRAQAWMSRSYSGGFDGVKMGSLSRRKSFCSSKMELADFFLCSGVKLVAVDMPPHMQIHAVDCARKSHDSLEKFTARSLACTLKREFDGVYGPAWHCIVGTSFGSFVTHSVGGFMYFSMDQKLYILLFKTTVQKAE